jgi:D-alanyl-D-alanine carboxypeptidase
MSMKKFLLLISISFMASGCSKYMQDLPVKTCVDGSPAIHYSKGEELRKALDEIVANGVPGSSIAVYSNEGLWRYASGYSKLESKELLQACNLMYLQSVSKTYVAVAILQLMEEDKITLDSPMLRYLPPLYARHISYADSITVRMLLNHTSGLTDYNFQPAYVTQLLQHPSYAFTPEEYLVFIEKKSLDFKPGSRYSYRNINYLLLALIGDAITGDHAKYIEEKIFRPLGLTETFYRASSGYLSYPTLSNTYWDRHGNGIVENVSQLQRNNVAALIGDDGIVATPADAIKFLRGLMEGKLLSDSTLAMMKTWQRDKEGNPTYGLGLDYNVVRGKIQVGHSGGGIGSGCQLYYFPGEDLYIFIGINLGTVTESPLHTAVAKTLDRVYTILLD